MESAQLRHPELPPARVRPLVTDVISDLEASPDRRTAQVTLDVAGIEAYDTVNSVYSQIITDAADHGVAGEDRRDFVRGHEQYAQLIAAGYRLRQLRRLADSVENHATISGALNDFYSDRAEPPAPAQKEPATESSMAKAAAWFGEKKQKVGDMVSDMRERMANLPQRAKQIGAVALTSVLAAGSLAAVGLHEAPHKTPEIAPAAGAEPVRPAAQVVINAHDNIETIAGRYHVSVDAIKAANPHIISKSNTVHLSAGQKLKIPTIQAPTPTTSTVAAEGGSPAPTAATAATEVAPETKSAATLTPEQQALADGNVGKLSSILAQRILDNPNVIIQSSDNDRVRRSVESIVQNNGNTFIYDVDSGQRVDINPLVLKTVLDLAAKMPIMLNSLTTCTCHRPNSDHYSGNAEDTFPLNLSDIDAAQAVLSSEPQVKQQLNEGNHLHEAQNPVGLDELKKIFGVGDLPPAPPSPLAGLNFDAMPDVNGVDRQRLTEVLKNLVEKHGLTAKGAVYLEADMATESGVNPAAPGGGLVQLQGERRSGMPPDLNEQLDFLLGTEMARSGNGHLLDLLRDPNATDEDLQSAILDYERPGIIGNRFQFAGQLVSWLANRQ